MEWRWSGDGVEMEWRWSGDGVEMEWRWSCEKLREMEWSGVGGKIKSSVEMGWRRIREASIFE